MGSPSLEDKAWGKEEPAKKPRLYVFERSYSLQPG